MGDETKMTTALTTSEALIHRRTLSANSIVGVWAVLINFSN